MKILQINSSARRDASHSTRLAGQLVQRLRDADPEAAVKVRSRRCSPRPASVRPSRRPALHSTTR